MLSSVYLLKLIGEGSRISCATSFLIYFINRQSKVFCLVLNNKMPCNTWLFWVYKLIIWKFVLRTLFHRRSNYGNRQELILFFEFYFIFFCNNVYFAQPFAVSPKNLIVWFFLKTTVKLLQVLTQNYQEKNKKCYAVYLVHQTSYFLYCH